jgi:hypothetical protein
MARIANIDLIGLIVSKCDIHTAMHLTAMNKYVYRELSKQRKRLLFEEARNRIKDHVAELPSRIIIRKPFDVYWASYTIIKPELVVHVEYNDSCLFTYTVIVPRPLGVEQLSDDKNYVWILGRQTFTYSSKTNSLLDDWNYGVMLRLDDRTIKQARQVLGGWRNYFKIMFYRFLDYRLR